MEVWIGLMSAGIGTIVGAAAGAVATTITTRNRVDLELRAEFDNELRRLRFPVYQALHAASERLPREWLPGNEPTRADLRALRETFHKWYFGPQAGGMLLSEKARQGTSMCRTVFSRWATPTVVARFHPSRRKSATSS
jgi:hypothetical protein